MLRIAVCDDDKNQVQALKGLLSRYAALRGCTLTAEELNSAEQFLFSHEEKRFDLCLLDIEMPGMNGMALAKKLRNKGDLLPIIFITGFSDYMGQGFEVEALHYLLKPVDENKLFQTLDRFFQRIDKRSNAACVLLPCKDGLTRVDPDNILYCEAFGKTTAVYLTGGRRLACKLAVGQLPSLLPSSFLFCHRSYYVHLGHIASVAKTELTLDSGASLPISRRLSAAVNKAFIRYFTHRKDDVL